MNPKLLTLHPHVLVSDPGNVKNVNAAFSVNGWVLGLSLQLQETACNCENQHVDCRIVPVTAFFECNDEGGGGRRLRREGDTEFNITSRTASSGLIPPAAIVAAR
jgi:hypothetical protein